MQDSAFTMTSTEKPVVLKHEEFADNLEHSDEVTAAALGNSLPKHYYRSPQYIMSFVVCGPGTPLACTKRCSLTALQ